MFRLATQGFAPLIVCSIFIIFILLVVLQMLINFTKTKIQLHEEVDLMKQKANPKVVGFLISLSEVTMSLGSNFTVSALLA